MAGFDFEKLRQRKTRQGRGWQPKDGQNQIRILPPSSAYFAPESGGLTDFALEFHTHFLKPDGEETRVTRCLKDARRDCPACAVYRLFKDSPDPGLKALAGNVNRKERHLMNILDIQALNNGIQAFECGPKIYRAILDFAANPQWGDMFNPAAGRNFMIELIPAQRSHTGWNDYRVQPDPMVTNAMPALQEGWQQKLDELANSVSEYLDEQEIITALVRMGTPGSVFGVVDAPKPFFAAPAPTTAASGSIGATFMPATTAPVQPTYAPAPVAAPAVVPVQPTYAPAPVQPTYAPAPVEVAPAPAIVPVAAPVVAPIPVQPVYAPAVVEAPTVAPASIAPAPVTPQPIAQPFGGAAVSGPFQQVVE